MTDYTYVRNELRAGDYIESLTNRWKEKLELGQLDWKAFFVLGLGEPRELEDLDDTRLKSTCCRLVWNPFKG